MIVGVDVGYGYTKAVREDGRSVVFPSAVSVDAGSGALSRTLGAAGSAGHRVALALAGGSDDARFLVGEAALAAGAARTWDTRAAGRRDYDTLVLTAARLLGVSGRVDLAVGLPLALYVQPDERRALRDRVTGLAAWVSLDGEDAVAVEAGRVTVAPQCAGAYYVALAAEPALARKSCGVVDVGYRTCDFLLTVGGQPDEGRSGSLDVGIGHTFEAVARQVTEQTGVMVATEAVERATDGRLTVRGRELDLRPMLDAAQAELAEEVADRLRRAWGSDLDLLAALLLAGGGGQALYPHLARLTPVARLVPDPVTANARGFMAMMAAQGDRAAEGAVR